MVVRYGLVYIFFFTQVGHHQAIQIRGLRQRQMCIMDRAATDDNLTAWVDAMTFQILRYNTDLHHRWFDSGDLQSVEMLRAICNVCALTPQIKHWLPTQERAIVQEFKRSNTIPANLVIRISASKILSLKHIRRCRRPLT